MRYPAAEKLEIIRIVEQSHLPAKRALDQLGIARRTFYRWYDRYLEGGPEALEDRPSAPSRVWNRILLENYFLPWRSRASDRGLHRALQPPALSREPEQRDACRRLLRRASAIIERREWIKRQTIEHRRLQHRKLAA